MAAICYCFPIRAGKSAEVHAFFKSLDERSPEVVTALRRAGLATQAVLIVPARELDYLLIYSEGPNLRKSSVARLKSELSVDREFWEVLGRYTLIEEAVSLPLLAMWRDLERDPPTE